MTLFGPGVGECIVLHLGEGDWMVVDSCVSPGNTEPVALKYFQRIGIDPSQRVQRILATHWHDDHIQGIANLLHNCPKAEFAMSAALSGPQFFQLVLEVNAQNRLVQHNSSASEFAEILEVLRSRAGGKFAVGPNIFAQDGNRLFEGGYLGRTEVWALSPSAATITNAAANLAQHLMTVGDVCRFKKFAPNDLSVAILVRAGAYSLLLGADLENAASDHFGWKAVLSSTARPAGRSNAFKIAHHGSSNADHEGVWTSMLADQPIALITPYAKLSTPLPTADDVQRIKGRTNRAYCTTWPPTTKPPRRKGVDGIVNGATRSRRALNRDCGHIRLRLNLSDSSAIPSIEFFGSARQM